jgi:hypothetical protein
MPRIPVPYGWKRIYYRTGGQFVGIGWMQTWKKQGKRTIILDHELKPGAVEHQLSQLSQKDRGGEPDFTPYD